MKKKQSALFMLCCLFTINVSGQIQQTKKDSVLLTDICVEHICFGDSLSKIFNLFGTVLKDKIVCRSMETEEELQEWESVEFREPPNRSYWYDGLIIFEVVYPNLSEYLFYGCIAQKKGVVVSIKNIDLIIGETTAERVLNDFAQSITSAVKPRAYNNELHITMRTRLPNNLESVEGAFIREVVLYFTDNILRKVETVFDLN